jgi:pilus assembly protein Flp/PilA
MSQWVAKRFMKFITREVGPAAVEYAIMLMLTIIVCLAAITSLGRNANAGFSFVGSSVQRVQ